MANSNYYKRCYHARKRQHLCVHCAAPLPEGYTLKLCPKCRGVKRERERIQRERWRADPTICNRCGHPLLPDETNVCDACRETARWHMQKKTEQRRRENKCLKCGCQLPAGYEYVTCESCRAKQRERNHRRKKAAR